MTVSKTTQPLIQVKLLDKEITQNQILGTLAVSAAAFTALALLRAYKAVKKRQAIEILPIEKPPFDAEKFDRAIDVWANKKIHILDTKKKEYSRLLQSLEKHLIAMKNLIRHTLDKRVSFQSPPKSSSPGSVEKIHLKKISIQDTVSVSSLKYSMLIKLKPLEEFCNNTLSSAEQSREIKIALTKGRKRIEKLLKTIKYEITNNKNNLNKATEKRKEALEKFQTYQKKLKDFKQKISIELGQRASFEQTKNKSASDSIKTSLKPNSWFSYLGGFTNFFKKPEDTSLKPPKITSPHLETDRIRHYFYKIIENKKIALEGERECKEYEEASKILMRKENFLTGQPQTHNQIIEDNEQINLHERGLLKKAPILLMCPGKSLLYSMSFSAREAKDFFNKPEQIPNLKNIDRANTLYNWAENIANYLISLETQLEETHNFKKQLKDLKGTEATLCVPFYIQRLPQLPGFSNLEKLTITDSSNLRRVKFSAFPNIKNLVFTKCSLKGISLPSTMETVEKITINDCTEVDQINFTTFPNLKHLKLIQCSLHQLPEALLSHKKLETLFLEEKSLEENKYLGEAHLRYLHPRVKVYPVNTRIKPNNKDEVGEYFQKTNLFKRRSIFHFIREQ